jgi:hypothetical protein|tara:strand:- start:217 stop:393 length:177 start_codon:yes stop_codon:yes gene_type:complete
VEVYLLLYAGLFAWLPMYLMFKGTTKMWNEKYDINQVRGYDGIFDNRSAHFFSEEWLD